LNKGQPNRYRDVIKTLHDLPNLKRGNWYHSPLAPDDSHLAYIANEFPKLEYLRLDFSAPRGTETTISAAGLTALCRLPLTVLNLENAHMFTPEHFKAIASIETLESLLIDARRNEVPSEAVEAFRQRRPDVEVVVAGPDAKGPPQAR
jgi:hypothetical protein